VTLDAPALDAPLTGAVERIGLEVERQTIVGDAPAAHTDARVVRVEVALDPDSARRARGFTGLEVVGRIAVGAAP
jgi:HlyD family secretion protein